VEVSWDQNRAKYDWSADVIGSRNSGNEGDWSWLSTWWENRNAYTVSLRNWTVRRVPIWLRSRYRIDTTDVKDQVDVANGKPSDPEYDATIDTSLYYPGRIEDAKRGTHELMINPSVKLGPQWTINPRYAYRTSHYEVSGDPEAEISSFRSNTVAVGVLAQPREDLTWTLDVSRQFALTWTRAKSFTNSLLTNPATGATNSTWYGGLTPEFDASYTSANSEVAYRMGLLTLSSTGGVVSGTGDFDTTLSFAGVALKGPVAKREGASWETAYRFYDYDEDGNGGINDYSAHAIFFLIRSPFEWGTTL
jgi:hypothetical protein